MIGRHKALFRANPPSAAGIRIQTPDAAAPPVSAWVEELLRSPDSRQSQIGSATIRESKQFRLISLSVADIARVEGASLEHAAAGAYRGVIGSLQQNPPWHLVRVWNFVPRLLDGSGDGQDRYMRFNAGRHQAFREFFGGTDAFGRLLPTASGVGHAGGDLVIHALACREPGNAIANPRQLAPHEYSRRFGPLPPCFARATLAPDGSGNPLLLVGGTASVRGEESVHPGNLKAQLAETFENLRAVIRTAFASCDEADPLRHFSDLRIYHVRPSDLPEIREAVTGAFPLLRRAEWLQAELCRGDLLVEIEGLAVQK